MNHTPDRDTIRKLRAKGKTFREIGEIYGVTGNAVDKKFRYTPKPKPLPQGPRCIPQHVINYWRTEWGWSEEQIYETARKYADSVTRRE